jgi:hypothetical protein
MYIYIYININTLAFIVQRITRKEKKSFSMTSGTWHVLLQNRHPHGVELGT